MVRSLLKFLIESAGAIMVECAAHPACLNLKKQLASTGQG